MCEGCEEDTDAKEIVREMMILNGPLEQASGSAKDLLEVLAIGKRWSH